MNRAALYSKANGLQKRDTAKILKEYSDRINWETADSVLDIGCGSGDVTVSLLLPHVLHTCQRLVGVDVSPDMVQYATSTHKHPRLQFIQADIAMENVRNSELWKEAEGGFHKIFSFFCLHWVQQQKRAIRNIYSLLRRNGEALLVFLASCPIYMMYEALAKKSPWNEYMQDVSSFISPYQHCEDPKQEFTSLLQDVGFSSVDCKTQESCYEFDDIDSLIDALKAVNPFLDRIPKNLHADFVMDCLYEINNGMLASGIELNNNTSNKKITVQYTLLIAHVEK